MPSVTLALRGDTANLIAELRDGAPWDNGGILAEGPPRVDFLAGCGLAETDVRQAIVDDVPSNALLTTIARCLGGVLFPDAIYQKRQALGPRLRTYLVIDERVDWLPWELAELSTGEKAFLRSATPIVRYKPSRTPPRRDAADRLVLLVIISVDINNQEIGAARELQILREAIRPVDRVIEMRVLMNPGRDVIFAQLKLHRPAIVHFIGHGDAGQLKLWNGQQYEPWDNAALALALDNAKWDDQSDWAPEFVFLNACRTTNGKGNNDGIDRTRSVARVFLDKGAGAVFAMQGPVSGAASGTLARELYCALVEGATSDAAAALARFRLSLDPKFGQTRAPYLPALTVSRSPDDLLHHTSCLDSGQWIDQRRYTSIIQSCELLFPALEQFVDRDEDRWQILNQFAEGADIRPASILVGPSGMGKTWLLAWCMDGWLRRRRQVRYIQMRGCGDWLAFIQKVRDGTSEAGIIHEPLLTAMVDEITWRLNHHSKSNAKLPRRPETTVGVEESVPALADVRDKKDLSAEFHVNGLGDLADVLADNPDGVPFVLVLDDFGDGAEFFPTEHFKYLVDHFLKARVLRGSSRLHVILSLTDDQVSRYGQLPGAIPRFQASPISRDLPDYIRLGFKLRFNRELPPLWEQHLSRFASKSFTGAKFREALQTMYDSEELLS